MEGRVALDEDVRKWVPELRADRAITVRDLLGHTSGLRDGQGLLLLRDGYGFSNQTGEAELWALLARQRNTSFAPGSRQVYSNTGYLAARRVVEGVTRQPFAEFTRSRFFEPLAMARTTWRSHLGRAVSGLALGYRESDGGYERSEPKVAEIGPGGLITTVGDLQRWNAALASGAIAGGRALTTLMEAPVLVEGGTSIFGLGLMVQRVGGRRELGHDGGTDGYSAFTAWYPDDGVSVAVLCNDEGANATMLGRAVAALAFPVRAAPTQRESIIARPTRPFPAALAAGTYVDTILGRMLRLEPRGDSVVIGGLAFAPADSRAFARAGIGRIEMMGTSGQPALAALTTNSRGQRVEFIRSHVSRTSTDDFTRYAGRFASAELGVTYEIRATDAGIAVGIAAPHARLPFAFIEGEPLVLPAVLPDWFATGAFTFRFIPGADGRITRLLVSHERARNIEFVREQ